jgi:hypothetical protein
MLNILIRCLSTFGLLAVTHAHPHLLERLGQSGNVSSDFSPAEALKALKEGNQRFMQHYKDDHKGLIETLAKGQKPIVSPWCHKQRFDTDDSTHTSVAQTPACLKPLCLMLFLVTYL